MFREPGHSASSMTSLPPSCRAIDLPIPRRAANVGQVRAWMFREPGHSASSMTSLPPSCRSADSAGPQMLAKSGRGCFRELGHSASSMTSLPPSCRAVVSAGPPMLAKSGRGCFQELGHCIFHDFLAAGLPSCRFGRAANVGQVRARMFSGAGPLHLP